MDHFASIEQCCSRSMPINLVALLWPPCFKVFQFPAQSCLFTPIVCIFVGSCWSFITFPSDISCGCGRVKSTFLYKWISFYEMWYDLCNKFSFQLNHWIQWHSWNHHLLSFFVDSVLQQHPPSHFNQLSNHANMSVSSISKQKRIWSCILNNLTVFEQFWSIQNYLFVKFFQSVIYRIILRLWNVAKCKQSIQ